MRHDPDHRLGAGIADHQPAFGTEPRLGGGNRAFDAGRFERAAIAEAHIAQQLRYRLEHPAHLARLPPGLDDRRQDLQRRDQPVAGRRVIAQDDVAGLLAAEIAAKAAHLFDDIAVADPGAVQTDALPGEIMLEAEIRHDRGDQRAAREAVAMRQLGRDQRHQLIAVENDAALVGDDQPVGVAVERDADVGAPRQHLAPHVFRRQRAAFAVDVEAVGRDRDREHLGAQFPEHGRRDLVGGAMRAIDDDAQPVEPQPFRKALLDELDVAAGRVVEPLGAAELRREGAVRRPLAEGLFDPGFQIV